MMSTNLANIWLFDIIIAALGFIVTTIITVRYYHLFKHSDSKTNEEAQEGAA